jgi:hypothetical protein
MMASIIDRYDAKDDGVARATLAERPNPALN